MEEVTRIQRQNSMEVALAIEDMLTQTISKPESSRIWKEKFSTCALEDLAEEMRKLESFRRSESRKKCIGEPLKKALDGFMSFLTSDTLVCRSRLNSLCSGIFRHFDLYYLILKRLNSQIDHLKSDVQLWNVFLFLRYLKVPTIKFKKNFYRTRDNTVNKRYKRKAKLLYQRAWLSFIKLKLPKTLIKSLVPYLSGTVLSEIKDGHFAGDFMFRIFKYGDFFAVLSLEGIFKLITEHNFEYPDFFEEVYKITTPSICYSKYCEKFLNLLDKFLSSTHLPSYIVASFIKRLSRIALLAPFNCMESLLLLIRNLLVRHDSVRYLVHREEPASLKRDPYDIDTTSLLENEATNSSLWELKIVQKHWLLDVAKRANYIDKSIPHMESFIVWKSADDYFSQTLHKKFGNDIISDDQTSAKINDVVDSSCNLTEFKSHKKVRWNSKKDPSKFEYKVPININPSTGPLFNLSHFNIVA